ncbi:MAG: hypothetical protein IKC80_03880 [Kiritimatiellae bacterium]|nr:hypothetical protein [Kiritimatiellia bacterium]
MKRILSGLFFALSALGAGAEEFKLEGDLSTVIFDGLGRVVSLKEKDSARELLAKPTPFVGVGETMGGRYVGSVRSERSGDLFKFFFAEKKGEVVLKVENFNGGFTFTVVDFTVPDSKALYVGRMAPVPKKWIGRRANMASDEKSGLCVRAYDLYSEMHSGGHLLQVRIPVERAVGSRFGIVGAPREKLQASLQAMTLASGRPHSAAGGAWALGSEATRGSYLNANVTASSLDDWIDLCERGGFDVLHFRERWYSCRGHYPVNAKDWPGGLADMKAAVAKIHAAGYHAGLHTLTACIDPKDPWVAGIENSDLLEWENYTLAEDLSADAVEMTVNEPPKVRHDKVFTYSGNGNAIRIGNEIVQYSGFTATAPYRYTGLKRGAFGTKAASHGKGEVAGYLQQRYIAFYPRCDSPLADKVVDAIADVYNSCSFDQIYCDGAEGMFSPYGTATMRDKIISRCTADGRSCLNEDSTGGSAHTWWYHSRVGAWDSCYWAPKRFHDFHVESVKRVNVRQADMLEIQMGWWAPLLSNPHFSCHKLDDMEYYASRNAGLDASMSIAGVDVSRRELPFHHSRAMTILGWYERARRARAFLPEVRKRFDRKGAEFRFRQNADTGNWEIAPVECVSYRAVSPWSERKSVEIAGESVKAALRVEALYAGTPHGSGESKIVTEKLSVEDLKVATADAKISMKVEPAQDDDGKRAFRLSACNATGSSVGAWARASAVFKPYVRLGSCRVMRFKVKGDGSGALLNVQPETPREYGQALAEHYITLDFSGWRDFEIPLRERDAARYGDYKWPYKGYAAVFHRIINMDNLSALNFYLNEIPSGGKASVEISDVAFVPQRQLKIRRHGVKVNGKVVPVPFEMYSGWFAELEDGVWTLYSADGEPLRRTRAAVKMPKLNVGANEVVYRGESADGTRPRAEVTLFALGRPEKAVRSPLTLDASARRFLAYEAMDAQFYAPDKGFDTFSPVVVRPGETAEVELTVYGPMSACRVKVGSSSMDLPPVAKGTHRRFRFEGEHRGVCPVCVDAKPSDEPVAARFEFVKRYRQSGFMAVDVTPSPNSSGDRAMTRVFGPYKLAGVDSSTWVAMGSGGLTNLTERVGSYAFLAIADPKTRKGYVAGWLTDEWASGSVHYGPEGLTFKAEYGRLKTGADVSSQKDTFVFGAFDDCRLGLEAYADEISRRYDIELPPQISGYCTWYCDRSGFTLDKKRFERGSGSASLTREFLAKVKETGLRRWGMDYYQIDDTWQDGVKRPGPAKVFCRVDPEGPYPRGMKPTADDIAGAGLVPGLWYMPFSGAPYDPWWASRTNLFVTCAENAPAKRGVSERRRGGAFVTPFGDASLDFSNPAALDYARRTAALLTKEWGYRMLKFDGMYAALAVELGHGRWYESDGIGGQVFFDPAISNVQAYRRALGAVIEGCAEGTRLLACNVKQNARGIAASYGLVDMLRIGSDNGPIDAFAQRYMAGPLDASPRYFFNGRVWYNDPDPVYVRNSVSLARARLFATWTAISGVLYNFSDWLPALSAERVELLKRTMSPHRRARDVRPVDYFERTVHRLWKLDGDNCAVFALCNWETNSAVTIDYDAAYCGLDPEKTYVGFDYWADEFVPEFKGRFRFDVPADSCRAIAVREALDRPFVISTSRHVASPVFDVSEEKWDAASRTLSGRSSVVSGERYELRIVDKGRLRRVEFHPDVSDFSWSVSF